MQDVEVFVEGEQVVLRAPYNPRLAPFVDDMSAKWDRDRGLYNFPVALAPHVVALAESFFGTSGKSPLSTFNLDCALYADRREVEVAGRILVERVSVSRRPKLGPGILMVAGTWTMPTNVFAGSPLIAANDAVLQMVLPQIVRTYGILGLTEVPTIGRREALQAEAAALANRLAVVTKELSA
ncbi:hypothetical protein B5P43_15560 [Bacillus sp. SRB_336]|nr:hypothetical protein B5P43_15560 [Bacillus sp. SRB_336]